ncbi:hypothetical protein [Trinickia symbiotica]|nr:hypothetical protein [Trinickia symbiotica]
MMENAKRWMTALIAALVTVTFQIAEAADANRHDPAPTTVARHAPGNSPIRLRVEAPTGRIEQLAYRPGQGWSSAAPARSDAGTAAPRAVRADAEDRDRNADGSQPMSVFIDGPTGYTYVWNRDKGWTFVGRISNRIE